MLYTCKVQVEPDSSIDVWMDMVSKFKGKIIDYKTYLPNQRGETQCFTLLFREHSDGMEFLMEFYTEESGEFIQQQLEVHRGAIELDWYRILPV